MKSLHIIQSIDLDIEQQRRTIQAIADMIL